MINVFDTTGIEIEKAEQLQEVIKGEKKQNKGKVTDIKREIRAKIENGILAVYIGRIFNERQIAVLMVDETVHIHNKYDAGNNDINVIKLIHEVFCSLFCEYLGFTDSKNVRYCAWYINQQQSNEFVDYIGFKF